MFDSGIMWKLGAWLVHPQALALDVLSKEVEVRCTLRLSAVCIAVAVAGKVPEPEEEPDEPEEEEEPEGDDLETWICCCLFTHSGTSSTLTIDN